MSDYKYDVGQRVSFTVPRSGCAAKFGTIVRRWWYASQGFVGFPMYDIDCGELEVFTGVDEDRITLITPNKPLSLSSRGREQLRKELAEQRAALRAALMEVRKSREKIKEIRGLLK